jgi:hypothetical protein
MDDDGLDWSGVKQYPVIRLASNQPGRRSNSILLKFMVNDAILRVATAHEQSIITRAAAAAVAAALMRLCVREESFKR